METIEQRSQEKRPFVSVMILSYNYGHLLGRALDACAAQTFRNFEIVMINNGSTDITEDIYKDFCSSHQDIETVYVNVNPNNGPANGWNKGLEQAHGEYVMFNDADDWMDPECLEKLANIAMNTGADMVKGQYREVAPDGKIIRERVNTRNRHRIQCPILQCTIFRRSVIMDNHIMLPIENRSMYDMWFVYNFANVESNTGSFYNKTIYNYLYNPESEVKKIVRWNLNDKLANHTLPGILMAYEVIRKTSDKKFQNELVYWTVRLLAFDDIIYAYIFHPQKEAANFHRRVQKYLQEYFPDYKKNPMVWTPMNNGDEIRGRLLSIAVIIAETLHCELIIRMIAKLSKYMSNMR